VPGALRGGAGEEVRDRLHPVREREDRFEDLARLGHQVAEGVA